MPIYEYQCTKCNHHLEALQKISDKPLRECPECGRHTLIRLVSAPLFRLAGGGWYETDFKSDKETKRNLADKGESEAPKGDAKPAETKTDAKPAKEEKKRTMVTKPAAKSPARAKAKSAPRKAARGRRR
jgi:putative FmdB family regulatory protein